MLPLLFVDPDGSICRLRPNSDHGEPYTQRPLLCSSVEGRRCCLDCATIAITHRAADDGFVFVAKCGSRNHEIGRFADRYLDKNVILEFLPEPEPEIL